MTLSETRSLYRLGVIAVDNMSEILRDDRYQPYYEWFHVYDAATGICKVSLAGAVMAKTLGVPLSESHWYNFPDAHFALGAIHYLERGYPYNAYANWLNVKCAQREAPAFFSEFDQYDSRETAQKFIDDLSAFLPILEKFEQQNRIV